MNFVETYFHRYLGLGFSVIPAKGSRYGTSPESKQPLVRWEPYQQRHADSALVAQWCKQWPYCSVAIVTGRISDLVVIDWDDLVEGSAPPEKIAAARALVESLLRMETAIARTARGRHFYFRLPRDADGQMQAVPTSVKFLPGLDSRGEGGYVLAPPSIHPSGSSYVWERSPEEGIAPLPYWVLETLVRMPAVARTTTDGLGVRKYEIGKFGVSEGSRNQTAASYVGWLLRQFDETQWEAAWNSLVGWNVGCTPPMPMQELWTTFCSILKKETAKRETLAAPPIEGLLIGSESLNGKSLPAPGFAVRDFILDGTTQLFGKPKSGKSFLALQIALAVARGTPLFPRTLAMYANANHPQGYDSTFGTVLALSLEDSERRLKDRMSALLGGALIPPGIDLATQWPALFDGGLVRIEDWLRTQQNPRLVVIDPLAAFVGGNTGSSNQGNVFRAEYRMFRPIWELSQKWRVPILIVDHASKSKGRLGSQDPFDYAAGTLGGHAAVDSVMVMEHDDKKPTARIHIKGRDLERCHLDIEHVGGNPSWKLSVPKNDEETKEKIVDLSERKRKKQEAARNEVFA